MPAAKHGLDRRRKKRSAVLLVFLIVAFACGVPASAAAQNFQDEGVYQSPTYGHPDNPSEAWMLTFGGRLYDQWWAVLLADPPRGRHPSYPESGRPPALETWRCVTCHGWDYRGRDGADGRGPSDVRIVGIDGAAGRDLWAIVDLLRDDTHGFTEDLIPTESALALALFVSLGQIDTKPLIDAGTGRFTGDPERGRAIFQTLCAVCHDFDGRAWIEGDTDIGDTLGAIANNSPWRALHKVMNGQTYADMPAFRALGLQTVLDILSYVQTLPRQRSTTAPQ